MNQCDGKNRYKSEHEAKSVKKHVLQQRNRKIRIYECPTCFGWHLTSEEKRDRTMNKKTARLLKEQAKAFVRERGLANYEFGYKELKKLWNKTPANLKRTLGL